MVVCLILRLLWGGRVSRIRVFTVKRNRGSKSIHFIIIMCMLDGLTHTHRNKQILDPLTRSYQHEHVDATLRDVAPAAGVAMHRRCQLLTRHFLWLAAVDWIPKEEWPEERDVCHGKETWKLPCASKKSRWVKGLCTVVGRTFLKAMVVSATVQLRLHHCLSTNPPDVSSTRHLDWTCLKTRVLNDLSCVSILKSVCHIFPKPINNQQKRRYKKWTQDPKQAPWFSLASHHLQRFAIANQDKCDTYPDIAARILI